MINRSLNFCFPIFNHKYFEFDAGKMEEADYFRINLKWTRNTHHAGPSLYFEILGLFLALDIYDNRHWNYEEKRWEDCDTEEV